ncbi:MAG: hypothetical protein J07HQW2_03869 [Haloquadratum walsbyi J07HQW2]|uniref:Uncharacterized protein n=1 Tax=Haloquadratum walsbyi J07HQW2 TaxID=1238425 RepID=U1NKA3_9EURY|nr:MAG: hypothetical protein J07HQW2_03869 [Haloquadratum walsbyi J07HQW2]
MWVLILSVESLQAGRWPLSGSRLVFSLFLYWGLGLVGTFTVIVGVACGLFFTVVRGRFGDEEVTGRSLPIVGASTVFTGWITVFLLMLTSGVYLGGLLAAGVTLLALRRLPVVRTFLSASYRLDNSSRAVLSEVSFRSRHVVVVSIVSTVGFFVVAVGYLLVATVLYHDVVSSLFHVTADSTWYSLWELRLYFYPAIFVIISVPIAVIVNRYVNHLSPAQSIRQAVIEWSAFFMLVSFSNTLVILLIFSGW